ncbi:HSPBB protein, partial [Polypterus senegalus]|nr:HSPBB protein [Polypterus senegalus]
MNQVQHVLRNEIVDADKVPRWDGRRAPFCKLEKDGQKFSATLEVEGFTPEELTVKQVGRKVMLSGKKEKKEESEGGSYSYRYQEFRRELELPEDVNPEELSCSLNNGQLRIEATDSCVSKQQGWHCPVCPREWCPLKEKPWDS